MNLTRRIIASAFFLLLGLYVLSQPMPLFVGIEFGATGGWSFGGYGSQVTVGFGRHEIGIGAHRKNQFTRGLTSTYRYMLMQPSSKCIPYFELVTGLTDRDHMLFATRWYGAQIWGIYGGLGVRYKIWKNLAGFLSFGAGRTHIFINDPNRLKWFVPSKFMSLGIRYQIPLRKENSLTNIPESIAKGARFSTTIAVRAVPFSHVTMPSGSEVSMIVGVDIRAAERLYPTLYSQWGRKYQVDTAVGESFTLQGIGLGARIELLQHRKWTLNTTFAYFHVPHASSIVRDSRLWLSNGFSYAITPRLAGIVQVGFSFSKFAELPDCMAGLRWGVGRLSPSSRHLLRQDK